MTFLAPLFSSYSLEQKPTSDRGIFNHLSSMTELLVLDNLLSLPDVSGQYINRGFGFCLPHFCRFQEYPLCLMSSKLTEYVQLLSHRLKCHNPLLLLGFLRLRRQHGGPDWAEEVKPSALLDLQSLF